MLKKIFLFELTYRFQRWPTYIYFIIVFLLCFFIVTSPNANLGGAVGTVYANSPYIISAALLVVSALMPVITSAIMGVAVVRDFDHSLAEIIFSTPVTKGEYLLGKFLGSFVVVLFVGLAAIPGLASGYVLGEFLPWNVAWRGNGILTHNGWFYLQPFLLLMATNLFITGALFFMSGALGRQNFIIYTQGALLLLLYQLGFRFLQDVESQTWASLADPFGIQAFVNATRYWSATEKNTALVPLAGTLLANRVLWCSIGAIAVLVTYLGFSRNTVRRSPLPASTAPKKSPKPTFATPTAPPPALSSNPRTQVLLVWRGAKFYFFIVAREVPFIAIVISGMLVFFINALRLDPLPETSAYASPAAIIKLFDSFTLFLVVLALFYSGELIWAEKRLRINSLTDAMPSTNMVFLASKLGGLILIYFALLTALLGCGVLVSFAYGYYHIPLHVYGGVLYGATFSLLILFTILFFFIQIITNNKFVGFAICIVVFVGEQLLVNAGFEWDLVLFGSGNLNVYSDMNGFGHFLEPYLWTRVYWLSFAAMLFGAGVIRWSRNRLPTHNLFSLNKGPVAKSFYGPFAILLFTFIASGCVIFYNTRILNTPEGPTTKGEDAIYYELNFKKYDTAAHPKIVEASLQVDLDPTTRNFHTRGYYFLKNKTSRSISQVHVQFKPDPDLHVIQISFDRHAEVDSNTRAKHFIYTISPVLLPGDSLKMNFELSYTTPGFKLRRPNTNLAHNGTFLDQSYFPSIGYRHDLELVNPIVRNKYKLGQQGTIPDEGVPQANNYHRMSHDADRMRWQLIVSTEPDQVAIAPGRLRKQWTANGRAYFHYQMNLPIANRYTILSARYLTQRDKWNDIQLEVSYHPEHHHNVSLMLTAVKEALRYCEAHFGPYPYRVLRIAEFPRYLLSAPSAPTLIPFSEGSTFVLKVKNTGKDLDMVRYLTIRQVAGQWFGHHVLGADVNGGALLTEGLAAYTALMVLQQSLPKEVMGNYLRYELTRYLTGRASERVQEQPLSKLWRQDYLHTSKAGLSFFAMQDFLGDSVINRAIRSFYQAWAGRESPYPTPGDLLSVLQRQVPDSLRVFSDDTFNRIILFENRITLAYYEPTRDGKFEVTMHVQCEKKISDHVGHESPQPMNDWIDIGVFNDHDKLSYLRKHRLKDGDNIITLTTNSVPSKVAVDPLHMLIDRHTEDNTLTARKTVDLTGLPILND